jgi:hypothetical protein
MPRVLRFSPEGELKTSGGQVVITFSLPMIPITSHQELEEMGSVEGASITPLVEGTWKWSVPCPTQYHFYFLFDFIYIFNCIHIVL